MAEGAAEARTSGATAMSRSRPLRIAVFGGFGIGNFGNDASLEAVLNFLRAERPDAEISCICSKPAEVTARFGLPAITTLLRPTGIWRIANLILLRQPSTWINWVHSVRAMGNCDVMLIAGTGAFDDFRDTPLGWPSRSLRWCLSARMRGARVAYVSVGAGPIINPISRWLFKQAARLAQHRSYRDADSRAYMQGIGVDESRSAVLPDLAYLLPAAPSAERQAGAPLTAGVGIMNYRGWRDSDAIYNSYIETHIRLIEWLEAQGHKVRLLIGQTPADLVAVDEIEKRMGRTLMTPEERAMSSFHDAMKAAAETDVVIASRYHVQLASLKMRKPQISLSYGPKNDALLQDAGLGEFTQDIHAIDFDLLTRQFTTLANDRALYTAIVDERVSALEARIRTAMRELDAFEA